MGKYLLAAGVVTAALVGFIIWRNQTAQLESFTSDKIAFSYPASYKQRPETKLKGNLKAVAKFQASDPLAVIELYGEIGAIKAASVTRSPFLDYLEKAVEKTQAIIRPNYQKSGLERIKLSGRDASRFSYSYLAADKQTRLYINFFIIPVANDAYYLSIGSTDQKRVEADTKAIQPTIQLKL